MPQPSRISNFEWWLLMGVFALIDVVQLVLDLFVIGVAINRYLDIVAGLAMGLYLVIRGYKLDGQDWLVLGGSFLLEEIPVLDIAPAWTFDVWRFRKKDLLRREANQATEEARVVGEIRPGAADSRENLDKAA